MKNLLILIIIVLFAQAGMAQENTAGTATSGKSVKTKSSRKHPDSKTKIRYGTASFYANKLKEDKQRMEKYSASKNLPQQVTHSG